VRAATGCGAQELLASETGLKAPSKHFLLEAVRFNDGSCPFCNASVLVVAGSGPDARSRPRWSPLPGVWGLRFVRIILDTPIEKVESRDPSCT